MLGSEIKETPSVRMIALQTLLEYLRQDPNARRALTFGWYSAEYPILDLETKLMGLVLTDGTNAESDEEEDY